MKINYRNPELITSEPCLFKIWAGNHYYIWKCNSIRPLMASVQKQITKEVEVPKRDSIFYKLVEHCRAKRIAELSIEVIKNYPANILTLLIDEYDNLQAAKKDKKCLNRVFVNHQKYQKWISQEVINNFKIYYTKGKVVGSSTKDKNLRKFLSTKVDAETLEKIFIYIKERYK